MGDIVVAALGFADSAVLITDNNENMQKLKDMATEWAKRNGMAFNIDKCKAMILNVCDKNITLLKTKN